MPETSRVNTYLAMRPNCPQTPPVDFSGDGSGNGADAWRLVGPATQPAGSVLVRAGIDDIAAMTVSHAAGTTFYFNAGVHKFLNPDWPTVKAEAMFAQIKCKPGNTYIGAPGAILDGQNPTWSDEFARISFSVTGSVAANVTIKTLEVRNFKPPMEQYSANVTSSPGWLWEGVNYHDCNNGINVGSNGLIRYCWLHDNGQYGFATYSPPLNSGLTPAIDNVTIEYSEISGNGTWQDEFPTGGPGPLGTGNPNGNGRNGGCKFWDTSGMNVHHNYVHHNEYTALWADTNNVNMTVSDNWISDNYGAGVMYEISYNFGIQRNTFLRNGVFLGKNFASRGTGSFPTGAIYISEAGGDATVHSNWAISEIGGSTAANGNVFVDNWDGPVLYENPNRFCNSYANTSHKIWKPLHTVSGVIGTLAICNIPQTKTMTVACTNGSPFFTWVSGTAFEPFSSLVRSSDEGRPVTGTGIPANTKIFEPVLILDNDISRGLYGANGDYNKNGNFNSPWTDTSLQGDAVIKGRFTNNYTGTTGNVTITLAAGSINTEPAYTACRWPTKNVKVRNNILALSTAVLGNLWPGINLQGIEPGRCGLFSEPGSGNPSWSPYQASGLYGANEIQNRLTYNGGNEFSNNTYYGNWRFMPFQTTERTYAIWRAAPYSQDVGSTIQADIGGGVTPPTPTAPSITGVTSAGVVSFTGSGSSYRATATPT